MRLILLLVFMLFAAEARAGSLRFQVGNASFTVGQDDLVCVRWKFINEQPAVEIGLSKKASVKLRGTHPKKRAQEDADHQGRPRSAIRCNHCATYQGSFRLVRSLHYFGGSSDRSRPW